MILIHDRELNIPINERMIGTNFDEGSEERVFKLRRYTTSGVDLASFTFRIDVKLPRKVVIDGTTVEYDTAVLEKEVFEDKILLTWTISENQVIEPGTIIVQIRATEDTIIRWSSYAGAFYVENYGNPEDVEAPERIVTELIQLEAMISGALEALEQSTAEAETLEPGSEATVTLELLDGHYNFTFGIPKGVKGDTGEQGEKGDDGDPATITEVKYAKSASSTVTPTTWQDTVPDLTDGNFLWTRYTFNESTVAYSVARQGASSGSVTSINGKTGDVVLATSDLENDSDYQTETEVDTKLASYTPSAQLATVATSGSYNDLTDKPTTPFEQVNSDWTATSGVAEILHKPTIPTAVSQLTNDSGFQTSGQVDTKVDAIKTLAFTNVTVSVNSFVEDSTYEDYPYKADIALSGITSSYFAIVAFSPVDAWLFASVCKTDTDKIIIYASDIPEEAITIPTITAQMVKAVS